jgi:hypothetical protein
LIYEKYDIMLCVADKAKSLNGESCPLTAAQAKDLLGWQVESENIKFDKNYRFLDRNGLKVRTYNNAANRPFYQHLAEEHMLEILCGKWRLNFETVKIDRYGLIHDGQHRLIALVLAAQEWEKDRNKTIEEQKWQAQWDHEPTIDLLICTGMDESDETVNTIGTGKPRSLKDVLYRCEWFAKKPEKERRELAGITRYAIELLYKRTGVKMDRERRYGVLNFSPRYSHTEALAFLADHQRILECVNFIYQETAGTKKLSSLQIRPGTASGLLYLMGCSGTSDDDVNKYDAENNESVLDWSMMDLAQSFWINLAGKGKETEAVAEALLAIPVEASHAYRQHLGNAYIIKAWQRFMDGEKIRPKDLETETQTDGNDIQIVNPPRVGGIDLGPRPEGDGDEDE